MVTSPYENVPEGDWPAVTERLIAEHPLSTDDIVSAVNAAWSAIFESNLGNFRIGKEIQPKPQIMGFLLHELIPLELAAKFPGVWRGEVSKTDKDLVYIPEDRFSIEMKTSSHKSQVFGNRSYAQPQVGAGKSKDGYYLTVNFAKFSGENAPLLSLVRFGWLDHSDWIAQTSATGQQARVRPASDLVKLKRIYSRLG